MKRVFYLVVLLAVAAAFYIYAYPRLAGVGKADAQQTASTGNSGGQSGGKANAFAIGVVTGVAATQTVPITKTAVGYIEPVSTVVLRSQADGIVTQQNVVEGQIVKAGDVLFKLDDSALQATIAKDQAQTAKDQANSDVAQVTVQRDQDLVKKQVDPQSTLDTDMAVAKAAQATVLVDNAQLKADQVELAYMTIKAPMDGRIGTVNTSVGNVVHASDTSTGGLLTITQMTPLRVSFSVAEGDLDSFRAALAGSKTLPVQITAPGDKTPRATGTLSFIDSSVDTGSGTVVIKADVDNSAGKLWPGQYVSATTQLSAYANATTIPLVAVQESNTGPYVWLIGSDGNAKQQPITVQASIGDVAIISKGINPGDHVVTEGQLRLSNGAAVKETINKTTSVAATGDTATMAGGSDSGALSGSASVSASTAGSSAGAGATAGNS